MLLSLDKVTKQFPVARGLLGNPTSFVNAVDGVSFDLREGEILGVVGESGCGKSTLGRCAVGLYRPTSGHVAWNGGRLPERASAENRKRQRQFQMVFQNPYASLNPRRRVGESILEPLEIHDLFNPGERLHYVRGLLEQVGLSRDDFQKFPHEFSGGQRQRIGLARALACQPDLIVLDEPVSSLDVSIQASILNLLSRLNQEKKIAYLFISHDLRVVGYLSSRILVMYLGKVVEEGESSRVLEKPRHPYTKILLAASQGKTVPIQGEPPSPVNVPTGCPFHPRCPHAESRCRGEKQELMGAEGGWKTACWKWESLLG